MRQMIWAPVILIAIIARNCLMPETAGIDWFSFHGRVVAECLRAVPLVLMRHARDRNELYTIGFQVYTSFGRMDEQVLQMPIRFANLYRIQTRGVRYIVRRKQ